MNAFALSGLLTGVSSLAMGLFVLSRDRTSPLYRIWFLFTASVASWGFGGMWIALEDDPDRALLAWRVAFAFGVVWIPIFFYHFVTIFCEIPQKKLLLVNYIIGISIFPAYPFLITIFWGRPISFFILLLCSPGIPFIFCVFLLVAMARYLCPLPSL